MAKKKKSMYSRLTDAAASGMDAAAGLVTRKKKRKSTKKSAKKAKKSKAKKRK
jgi:hypothetical protein